MPLLLLSLAFPIDAIAKSSKKKTKKNHKAKVTQIHTEYAHFSQWTEVNQFIDQMVSRYGFEKEALAQTLDQAQFVDSSIQLIKPAPPGRPKNWIAYRARFVEPVRINAGIAFWNQYSEALSRAETQFGVPAEIIVGLIGVETVFGRNTGNFRVMDVLTTLGFAYPDTPTREARMTYFRKELETLLLVSREEHVDPFSFKGSYAGAVGWAQFMPSSIRDFAVDYDGDGKIDLSASPVDAIGSVANYLAQHGWKKNLPSVFPATLISPDDNAEQLKQVLGNGLKAAYTLRELKPLVGTSSSSASESFLYGLIDLQNGEEPTEYWLATDNFFAITQYNRSYFYAMSVIDLGKNIALARSSQ